MYSYELAVERLVGKYFPYGQERPSATTDGKEKFATYFRDSETGLDYADQRYHQPGMGRFMTPDPYAASGGPSDPGSWNRYAYTRGDPVNRIDPGGQFDCRPGTHPEPHGDGCVPDSTLPKPTQPGPSLGGGGYCDPTTIYNDPLCTPVLFCKDGTVSQTQCPVPKCPTVPLAPLGVSINDDIAEAQAEGDKTVTSDNPLAMVQQLLWFYNKVRNGGEWDYKKDDYNKPRGAESAYADYGNFNYGATCLAVGFSEGTCLRMAGWAQTQAHSGSPFRGNPGFLQSILGTGGTFPYGDDPKDSKQIMAGFAYYYAKKEGCQ